MKTDMKPCPFCGEQPEWMEEPRHFWSDYAEPRKKSLGCVNSKCAIQPHAEWRDTFVYKEDRGYRKVNHDAQAVRDWNKRFIT